MDVATTLRRVRQRAGLSLRGLAARAGTSHATIAAYEHGRKVPTADTLDRLIRAAGFEADLRLVPAVGGPDALARGRELEEVLGLAEQFPARHDDHLAYPVFGRA
ncbi:MAG: helix-turn-helix transcriptional regulator [Acidimicrobiales bacterium]|nr:helix-turn-helix transcriptional regulator [Acidimicrobiales bacterium]